MNFIEALKKMQDGRFVQRPDWVISYGFKEDKPFTRYRDDSDNGFDGWEEITSSDTIANNWEVSYSDKELEAPEGSLEWALKQMRLGEKVTMDGGYEYMHLDGEEYRHHCGKCDNIWKLEPVDLNVVWEIVK